MENIHFPLILAGPILRRTEVNQVFLWVATSRKVDIDVDFYKLTKAGGDENFHYDHLEVGSENSRITFGKNLFIHLIKVIPQANSFPVDTMIGYNLHFSSGEIQENLESLYLLSAENSYSIVYGNLKYPTFQIKQDIQRSNIIYGSCRKLHGENEDALALADQIMMETYDVPEKRPEALFLMGDQIYADDVAHPVIMAISALGKELIGYKESLEEIDSRLKQKSFQTRLQQINGRQYIMENFCEFTSSQAQNHLIELGDFAVMYLLSWSPALWETAQSHQLFESFEDVIDKKQVHFVFPNDGTKSKEHKAEKNKLHQQYIDQQEALISFQETLPQIRRLLANIPTYMIFDDHDITDDWNLSSKWKKNVYQSKLGKHVVANGLLTYWAFQGWGNDPEAFDRPFIKTMKSYLQSLENTKISKEYETWAKKLWNFHSWHFVAPTYPNALFLDTRTQREDDDIAKPVKFGRIYEEVSSTPLLISNEGWDEVTARLFSSGWKTGNPLLIISATPVYGMGLIESFLHDFIYPFKVLGVEVQTSFDFEAWKYNGKGFTEFLFQVAKWNPSPCIILSGDVHYASAVNATVTFQDDSTLPIYQMTCSPMKNMSFSGLWGLLMKMVITLNVHERKNKHIQRICTHDFEILRTDLNTDQAYLWKDELSYQFLDGSSIIETNNNIGLVTISKDNIKNTLLKK